MKKLIMVISILTAIMMTNTSVPAQEEGLQIYCASLDSLAAVVMRQRQDGIVMSEMFEAINGVDSDEAYRKIARKLIQAAYEEPRFSTPEYQEAAVVDFRNAVFSICMKGGGQ